MKSRLNRANLVVCIGILLIFLIPKGYTQQKRILTPENYKLWSTIYTGTVSKDGKWSFYTVRHKDGKDTLYVNSTVTDKKYSYPLTSWGDFSPDSKWFAFIKSDSLNLQDLQSGEKDGYNGIINYSFTTAGRYLLAFKNDVVGKSLLLIDLKTNAIHVIKNVKEQSLNPDKDVLAVITEENGFNIVKAIILKPGFPYKVLVSDKINIYNGLTWNKVGTSIAFYEQKAEDKMRLTTQKIYLCRNVTGKVILKTFDSLKCPSFPKELKLTSSNLYLSDDGKQLFLYLRKVENSNLTSQAYNKTQSDVRIWHWDDKEMPPPVYRSASEVYWFNWWVDSNKLIPVGDSENTQSTLTGDQKNVLLLKTADYMPQYKFVGKYCDLYIKNLNTGIVKLIVKKVENEFGRVQVSPAGKYVSYFKDNQWWVYDINKKTNICVTEGLKVHFEDIEYDLAGAKEYNDKLAFLDDDSGVVVADEFDLWLISPDGTNKTKITQGRNKNIAYRISSSDNFDFSPGKEPAYQPFIVDSKKGILIKSLDIHNLDEGICLWNKKDGLTKLVNKGMKLVPVSVRAEVEKPFLFTESDFDVSQRLMALFPSGEEKLLYQSNPQQKDFYWGKSELLHCNTPEGKKLKAALFYPANYDPAKKYPMVVYIYEKLATTLHEYENPSISAGIGFNVTNLTAQGYFVLQPDIVYTLNEPGISATHCVIAATESVISKGFVDKNRIGLMGYSFGGYETGFIVSQTNLFKTAIAGAGIYDLVDFYLSISPSPGSNIWRFENQQFRLQAPFDGDEFRRNSTLTHVRNINTPLLIFTGDKDTQVDWQQSRKFHIALWRLGKKSNLIFYPNEMHGGFNEVHSADITMRVKDWFDYYLKEEEPAEWMHINK